VLSLVCADALHALLGEDDDSFAGAFFDPPYGLGEEPAPEEIRAYLDGSDLRTGDFLGHAWDVPPIRVWREVFRVLAPGAHLVVFGGTRTFDLISLGIRMAGFELRDTISGEGVARWYRGVGFSQGADVGKMIDKARPHRRADVLRVTAWIRAQRDARGLTNAQIDAACGTNGMAGHWTSASTQPEIPSLEKWEILRTMLGDAPEWMTPLLHSARQPGEAWFRRPVVGKHDNPAGNAGRLLGVQTGHGARGRDVDLTTAAGDLSAAFEGYKTQLKGLWEPILVFRKPLGALSIAACAVEHATGAFNVDECRLSASERMNCAPASSTGKATYGEMGGSALQVVVQHPRPPLVDGGVAGQRRIGNNQRVYLTGSSDGSCVEVDLPLPVTTNHEGKRSSGACLHHDHLIGNNVQTAFLRAREVVRDSDSLRSNTHALQNIGCGGCAE
jgi:hypothetical protein